MTACISKKEGVVKFCDKCNRLLVAKVSVGSLFPVAYFYLFAAVMHIDLTFIVRNSFA